jgi:hypothetical protein
MDTNALIAGMTTGGITLEEPPPPKEPTVAQQKPSYTMTPGAEEIQSANTFPAPPEEVPPWNEVTALDDYKNASPDDKLNILDKYVRDSRAVANNVAAQNKEDPAQYQKGIDQFEAAERAKLESPLSIISNTAKAGARGALSETTKIAVGGALAAKDLLQKEQDFSDIKDMPLDDAKYQRDTLEKLQPDYEKQKADALLYLHEPLKSLQNPTKYPPFPGGTRAAIAAAQNANMNDRRLKALNDYIDSNGQIVPQQSSTEAAAQRLKELPGLAENAIKVDQIYLREHPQLNNAADTLGRLAPFLTGTAAAMPTGPEGVALMEGAMNYADSFQNGYESAQAKLDERERQGEHFTPDQREQLALNDASQSAFGVGSWQTVSNFVLGTAMEGLHLPVGSKVIAEQNLKKFLLSSTAEIGGQVGLQTGAQVFGNLAAKRSGVSPDQDLFEGAGKAATTGLIFGGTGAVLRAGGALIDHFRDQHRIDRFSDNVRTNSDKLFQSGVDPDMTRESAFDAVLNETVPAEYRDRVRANILKQGAAEDLNQSAQELAQTSPLSAAEQSKVAEATKNTPVTKVGSKADQLRAQLEAKQAAKDAEKQAKGEQAGKPKPPEEEEGPPAEGATPPPGPPPTPGTPPTSTETTPPTTPVPEPKEEDPTKIAQRNTEIQGKLKELFGDNPTAKQLQDLGYEYLRTQVYPQKIQLQNWGAHRLLHELGIVPAQAVGKNWGKVTGEMMGQLGDHFNNFLSDKIKEATAKTTAAGVVPGAPPAAAPTDEAERGWVVPPELMKDAVEKNDPSKLIEQLQQGKRLELTTAQSEEEKVDQFLYDHKFESEIDGKTGNLILKLPEGIEYHPLALEAGTFGAPKGRPEGETREVDIAPNSKEFAEETESMLPHPQEDELLEKAAKYIYGPQGSSTAAKAQKDPVHQPKIQSAAMQMYRRDLRRYAEDMAAAGKDVDEEKPPGIRPPLTPQAALTSAGQKLGQKLAAAKVYKPPLVSLDKPLGESGEATLHEQLGTTKSEEALAKEPGGELKEGEEPEEKLKEEQLAEAAGAQYVPELDHTPIQDTGSQDFHDKIVNEYLPHIDQREQRELWYYLDKKLGGNIILPEGVQGGSARGITAEQANRAGFRFFDWFTKNTDARRGTEEAPPGAEPEHPGPGKPGGEPSAQKPGQPPTPHAEPVPVHGLPGTEPHEPAPEDVRAAGAATQEPGKLLPAPTEREAGGTAAGGAGGERGASIIRPGGESAVPSKRVAIVRERPTETTEGGRRPSTATSPGTEPGRDIAAGGAVPPATGDVTGTGITLDQIAKAFLKNRAIADEYDIDLEDASLQDVKDRLEELEEEASPEDHEAFYREMADALKLKPEKAPAAPTVTPTAPAAEAKPARSYWEVKQELDNEENRLESQGIDTPSEKLIKLQQELEAVKGNKPEYKATLIKDVKASGNDTPSTFVDKDGRRVLWSELPGGTAIKTADGKIYVAGGHTVAQVMAYSKLKPGTPTTGKKLGFVKDGNFYPVITQEQRRVADVKSSHAVDELKGEPLTTENFGGNSLIDKKVYTEKPYEAPTPGKPETGTAAARPTGAEEAAPTTPPTPEAGGPAETVPGGTTEQVVPSKLDNLAILLGRPKPNIELAKRIIDDLLGREYPDDLREILKDNLDFIKHSIRTGDISTAYNATRQLETIVSPGKILKEPAAPAPEAPTTPAKPAPEPRTPPELIRAKGVSKEAKSFSLVRQIAKTLLANPEFGPKYGVDLREIFSGDPFDPDKQGDITHLSDSIDTGMEGLTPDEKLGRLERMATWINGELTNKHGTPETTAPAPPTPPVEAGLAAQNQTLSQKIFNHFLNNPNDAEEVGLVTGITQPQHIIDRIRSQFAARPPSDEVMNQILNRIGQKFGIVEPPKPPGGTESGGVMHSLAPGLAGVHHFSGQVNDLVGRFRNSVDPDMQAFAISLNANRDTLTGMPVRQLNTPAPVVFYHDDELWVSPSAVRNENGEHALAHEIQHAIAQQKIASPKTAEEHDLAAHWNDIHNELRKSLPADLRDAMDSIGPIFDDYEANQELDTRFLTRDEKNWLPILYAAHKPGNMMQAVFSNPAFRDYLHSVRSSDGRTLLERVQHWGNTVFGQQAFKYADRAETLVGKHPGILTRFNPKVFDLRGAYPLTESEKQVHTTIRKYGLRGKVEDSLAKVAEVSNNPRHVAIAKALGKAFEKYPEIRIGLENRLGGYAGGYDFQGDRVTINPHYNDEAVEASIIHEAVHGLTLGKIDAYQKGMTHLLSAADCQAINDLEELRQTALKSKGVPDQIRRIANLDSYEQREKALVQLLQQDPSMNKWYGLTDTKEFASEVMSNGELQDHLARVPYRETGARAKPQSMLQRVFGWVKKFLGFEGDTALSKAFDSVVTLMGGRRVMENDIQVGGLDSEHPMVAKENMLAKRHLDQRAQADGYPDTKSVDPATLNQWLREYRDQKGLAQRDDPYSPRTVARPRTSAMSPASGKLSGMTDPRDIIEHLAKLNDVSLHDTDSLRQLTDRAFKDRALSLDQYLHTHGALNELEGQTYNRIYVPSTGDRNDRESVISRFMRSLKQLRPRGEMPVEAYETLQTHLSYAKQATAFEMRNRLEDYHRAIAKEFKGGKPTTIQNEDMNTLLEGGTPPRTYSTNLINALSGLRDMIDMRSFAIADEDMVSNPKKAKITANLGKYMSRSYRLFDDPRWFYRPESKIYRAAAEAEADKMLKGKDRAAEARRVASSAGEKAARAFTPGTTAYNLAHKNAYDTAYAAAMKNIGPHFLNRKMQEWQQVAENRQSRGNFRYGHAFSINDKLMEELQLEDQPAIRALIGEERDPEARFAKTVWRQQNFLNTNRVANDLAKLGRRGGYISDHMSPVLNRQIPEGFYHLGALKGKYTTPEVAAGLTAAHQQMIGFEDTPIGKFFRSFESRARYFSTILSLQRSMANLHSAFFSHLNNGYWNPLQPRAWKAAGDVFWGQLLRQSNPEREAFLMKLNRLGLSDKESNINYVMDFLKSGDHIMDRTPQDFMEDFQKWWDQGRKKLGVDWATEHLTDLHTVWNFISKASQFMQQVERERTFNNWDVANRGARRLTTAELEDRAAQVVRETNISYSRVSPLVARWRKNPVLGTFLTYAEQSIQSYVMSWVHALKNLRSDNPYRKMDGAFRLGGTIVSLLVPWGLQAVSQKLNGVGDQEDKNFRSMLPPWEKNNAIVYGSYDPQTKRRFYWDTTYSSQQGDIGRAIHALLAPNHDGIIGKARDSAYELFHPALNLGLIPGALVDLSRNQTEYGTQVYNPSDTWLNNAGDISKYLVKREFGGTVGRAWNKGGLAIRGQEVSPGGAVYNMSTSLAPELLGMRIEGMSFPERLRSELYSSKDSIDHAQQIFTGPIQRSGNELTDTQIADLYQRSDDARRVVFNELHQKIEAARFGGMSTIAIKQALKARRYSTQEIDDLMSGRYRSFKPSAAVLENAKKNGNHVPPHLFSRQIFRYDTEEEPAEESE